MRRIWSRVLGRAVPNNSKDLDAFLLRVKESKTNNCLTLKKKALLSFQTLKNTCTRSLVSSSTTMRQRKISTDFCLLIWNFWNLTFVFYNISREGVVDVYFWSSDSIKFLFLPKVETQWSNPQAGCGCWSERPSSALCLALYYICVCASNEGIWRSRGWHSLIFNLDATLCSVSSLNSRKIYAKEVTLMPPWGQKYHVN